MPSSAGSSGNLSLAGLQEWEDVVGKVEILALLSQGSLPPYYRRWKSVLLVGKSWQLNRSEA